MLDPSSSSPLYPSFLLFFLCLLVEKTRSKVDVKFRFKSNQLSLKLKLLRTQTHAKVRETVLECAHDGPTIHLSASLSSYTPSTSSQYPSNSALTLLIHCSSPPYHQLALTPAPLPNLHEIGWHLSHKTRAAWRVLVSLARAPRPCVRSDLSSKWEFHSAWEDSVDRFVKVPHISRRNSQSAAALCASAAWAPATVLRYMWLQMSVTHTSVVSISYEIADADMKQTFTMETSREDLYYCLGAWLRHSEWSHAADL